MLMLILLLMLMLMLMLMPRLMILTLMMDFLFGLFTTTTAIDQRSYLSILVLLGSATAETPKSSRDVTQVLSLDNDSLILPCLLDWKLYLLACMSVETLPPLFSPPSCAKRHQLR